MYTKLFIGLAFVFIIYSLGSALFYLRRAGRLNEEKMARALTWRISLSIALFVFVIVAFQLGWISPTNSIVV